MRSASRFLIARVTPLAVLVCVGVFAATAPAAVITSYNFDDQVNGTPDVTDLANKAAVATGVTSVSDLGFGVKLAGNLLPSPDLVGTGNGGAPAGVSFSTSSMNGGPQTDFLRATSSAVSLSEADAVTDGSYVDFTVNLDPAYQIDLTSLTFVWDSNNDTNQVPRNLFVAVNDVKIGATQTAVGRDNQVMTFDLSSLTALTGSPNFKVYMYAGGSSNSRNAQFDDFQLNGEVSLIPEPASLALLGLGGLLIATRRR